MLSLIRGCGGYTMISKDLLGCATSRNKGTCDNRLNIRRDALEASVLSGLRTHLMEYSRNSATSSPARFLRIERGAGLAAMRDELPRIERELGKLLAAIKARGPIEAIVEDMKRLEARKAVLKDQLANAEEPPPLLHPNMAEIYRQRIAALYESLQNEDGKTEYGKTEAAEVFRTLVDQVTLVPDKAELGDRPCGATWPRSCGSPQTRKTPTSFRRLGFWLPCFRKNRWLRGHATPDSGEMERVFSKSGSRKK
ncbi:hypothetical protein ABIB73_007234 [Bradyrhizobium sp. F1.4.3]|uniref:hypothetical protein n=1 Tax=unclassified Bradyrhizobium TaxID=2631580 RepID=UPI003398EA98